MNVDLIISFNKGDAKARKEVFELVYRSLCSYAFQLTANEMEAEEIASDSIRKVFMSPDYKFNNIQEIKNLLYTITKNACKDHLRKTGREIKNMYEYKLIASETDRGENGMDEEERFTRLMKAIDDAIPQQPEQRKQVLEYMIQDKSAKEIAELMNIHISGVYKHRDAFIEYLHKHEGLDPNVLPAFFDF